MNPCPTCGAPSTADEDCRARFNACLALEYENPATYGRVHHLTVACYMLQHNAYAHAAWLAARAMLRQFVQHETTPADWRKRNQRRLDGGQRQERLTQGARFSNFQKIIWTRTIADVRLDNAETYCADVRLWASQILTDTAPVIE